MAFCSQTFLVFFGTVFAAYWAIPRHRARVWLLLGASLYFYASWNRALAALIAGSSTLDYAIARLMDRSGSARVRRGLLALSVGANLGLLGYFKYAGFFLDALGDAL